VRLFRFLCVAFFSSCYQNSFEGSHSFLNHLTF